MDLSFVLTTPKYYNLIYTQSWALTSQKLREYLPKMCFNTPIKLFPEIRTMHENYTFTMKSKKISGHTIKFYPNFTLLKTWCDRQGIVNFKLFPPTGTVNAYI